MDLEIDKEATFHFLGLTILNSFTILTSRCSKLSQQ